MKRLDLEFPSAESRCAAWLYLPASDQPAPVIIMAHGLGAVRDMRLDAFAERFAAAGYACLVFDYRHFGASGGEPRQLLDIRRQLADWNAALQFVRSRAEVDSTRVILWGTSFSGGHVLVTAANDPSIAAVIAQCPFTDGLASALVMNPLSAIKLTGLAVLDVLGSLLGRKPLMVDTVGTPGSAALMTAPDVIPGYLGLVPTNSSFANQVAARIVLGIVRHAPGRQIRHITAPLLLCLCDTDSVAPVSAALRHARKARQGEIKHYPAGHFDIYIGDWFEQVIADQLAFLKAHVPTRVR